MSESNINEMVLISGTADNSYVTQITKEKYATHSPSKNL